jgi:hypothetical protein
MKVFQIGFNRVGTTSLHKFFEANNHRSLHWKVRTGKHAGRNLALLAHENLWHKDRKMFSGVEDYVFYSDMEFVSHYLITNVYEKFELIEQHYPGSKFILNIRNREEWLRSRFNHGALPSDVHSPYAERFMSFLGVSESELREIWRRHFDEHINHVRTFFQDKSNQLLEFELGKTKIDELVSFLPELNFKSLDFTRSNVTPLS